MPSVVKISLSCGHNGFNWKAIICTMKFTHIATAPHWTRFWEKYERQFKNK
jgi:hypothetical protein